MRRAQSDGGIGRFAAKSVFHCKRIHNHLWITESISDAIGDPIGKAFRNLGVQNLCKIILMCEFDLHKETILPASKIGTS